MVGLLLFILLINMALTTQNIVKGLDLTVISNVSGIEINQLVDVAQMAEDKGLIIETQDSALDTPIVPNPEGEYSGVFPTYWKRFIWRRVLFDDSILNYCWDTSIEEDGTLLFWRLVDKTGTDALVLANQAITDSAEALAKANTAFSNANIAQITADQAQATADIANDALAIIQTTLQEHFALIESLWSAGDLKHTCKVTPYSTTEDEGWVECDGSLLNREVFATLFATIGTTWGPGDTVTTFAVPDFRGRCLIGRGHGAGLTDRILGLTNGGEEEHLLTGPESGVAAHKHTFPFVAATFIQGAGVSTYAETGVTDTSTTGPTDAAETHENMPPFGVARIVMKT